MAKRTKMQRSLSPKIYIFLLILAVLPAAGQTKASIEVDPTKCWAYPADEIGEELVTGPGPIFLGLDGAKVEAVSPDGKKIWSSDLGGEIRSNILAGEAALLVV